MEYTANRDLKINRSTFNHCIFGWGIFQTHIEHTLNPEFLMDFKNNVEDIDINSLVCAKHAESFWRDYRRYFLKSLGPTKYPNYLRAEISCRLNNMKGIVPFITDPAHCAEIRNIIDSILDLKFTGQEKKGDFNG